MSVLLRITFVATYPADPAHYEGAEGAEAMAALDQQSLDDGEMSMYDILESCDVVSLTVEPA